MVKGVSRQVILVRQPDRRLFDEAIFLVKEDALNRSGVTADQVLAEARRAAQGFVRRGTLRTRPPWFWGAAGALAGGGGVGLLWALTALLKF